MKTGERSKEKKCVGSEEREERGGRRGEEIREGGERKGKMEERRWKEEGEEMEGEGGN